MMIYICSALLQFENFKFYLNHLIVFVDNNNCTQNLYVQYHITFNKSILKICYESSYYIPTSTTYT
jgi:hypothetical protein